MEKRLLTVEEAATYLGLHPKSVRLYIDLGQLSYVRVGKRGIRLDVTQLDTYIKERVENRAA